MFKIINLIDMNKLLSFFVTVSLLLFVACQEDDTNRKETAGNIQGMGNAGGELQAEVYDFHEGLVFSEISGVGNTELAASLKSESDGIVITGSTQGSGDQVIVELTIENTNTEDACLSAWFRAGTVFGSNIEGVQNGILLAPVDVCVPAGKTKTFILYLYCLNLGMDNPDGNDSYEFLGVTTSKTVLELINALKFKKVNYEHYVAYPEVGWSYNEVKNKLQEILWKITNGSGMDANDIAYINSLPDLPTGVFPEYIYDLTIGLPDCWCIDECSVVENSGALSNIVFFVPCATDPYVEIDGDFYDTEGFPFEVEVGFRDPNYNGVYKDILDFSRSIKFEVPNATEFGFYTSAVRRIR